jgi:shikimate dehydrogenase
MAARIALIRAATIDDAAEIARLSAQLGYPADVAVFGHPVSHSLSPRIHAAFGKQTGIAVEYSAIDVEPSAFDAALQDFAARGGAGANVTLPLKEAAYALCSDSTERARRAGAVNTLIRNGDAWHGDTTDGAGLVRDLPGRHRLDLR